MTSDLSSTLDIIRYPPHHTHTTPTPPDSEVWFVHSISSLHGHGVNTQTVEQEVSNKISSRINSFTFAASC